MILISDQEEFNKATFELLYDIVRKAVDFVAEREMFERRMYDECNCIDYRKLDYKDIKELVIAEIVRRLTIKQEEITETTSYLIDIMIDLIMYGVDKQTENFISH